MLQSLPHCHFRFRGLFFFELLIFMWHLSPLVLFCCQRRSDLTSDHTGRCRPGAVGSFCFSPWHRGRRISCHWGSTCLGPKAGQPPCCLRSGWAGSRSRTVACLARPAGNTSSVCSPGNAQKGSRRGQRGGKEPQREREEREHVTRKKQSLQTAMQKDSATLCSLTQPGFNIGWNSLQTKRNCNTGQKTPSTTQRGILFFF